ncbi:hypothetical protein RHGRI_035077 [Rhododendron griersonianum]|uniref:CASP-like protein n=2 Tax=Rhododendron griersonianum TaxID=479676 RepID=A0AAV6I366_9ERIC|nr:hypothetical protein RHGRI_035077 [Rhododendron griersonianum]
MDSSEPKNMQDPRPKTQKYYLASQISLRLLAAVVSLTAATLAITDKQIITVYGIELEARYSYSSAFKYFASATIIACVFSVMSLIVAIVLDRKCSDSKIYFYMFLHDLVGTAMVISAASAATAIGLVARDGNNYLGWMAICGDFVRFCNKMTVAVVLSYFSFVLYLLLTIISAKKIQA